MPKFFYKEQQMMLGSYLVLVKLQNGLQLVLSKKTRTHDIKYNI